MTFWFWYGIGVIVFAWGWMRFWNRIDPPGPR
jgi:hypothetical protein